MEDDPSDDSNGSPTVTNSAESNVDRRMDSNTEDIPDWLAAIRAKFEGSSITQYEPPRFQDDVPSREVLDRLEAEHGVTIRLIGENTIVDEDWTIRIDGESMGSIGRQRSREGYTVYNMTSVEFIEFVRSRIGSNTHQ